LATCCERFRLCDGVQLINGVEERMAATRHKFDGEVYEFLCPLRGDATSAEFQGVLKRILAIASERAAELGDAVQGGPAQVSNAPPDLVSNVLGALPGGSPSGTGGFGAVAGLQRARLRP